LWSGTRLLGMGAMAGAAREEATGFVAPAAAGDEAAFTRIVDAYHDDMRRVCVVVCGDPALADDAVQLAWSIAWRKLGSIREPARLRSWLIAVAANQARDLVRKRRRRSELEVFAERPDLPGGPDPATGIDSLDLLAAIGRLDPDDRALLAMRYVAGFNASELSAATGLTPSGTRNRLERLLTSLRQELSHE
jgi:RNA polymerase sigma factor (sigma-70 family)